jgi:hypothetical protein
VEFATKPKLFSPDNQSYLPFFGDMERDNLDRAPSPFPPLTLRLYVTLNVSYRFEDATSRHLVKLTVVFLGDYSASFQFTQSSPQGSDFCHPNLLLAHPRRGWTSFRARTSTQAFFLLGVDNPRSTSAYARCWKPFDSAFAD